MTLYCNLHLVLSKTIRIDDIKYHIWCSVDIHGTIHSFLDIPSLSQHYYYCYNALHPCQLFLKFNRWGFYPFLSSFFFSFFAHGSHYPTKSDLLGVLCNCWKFIKIGYPLRGCLHHGPLVVPMSDGSFPWLHFHGQIYDKNANLKGFGHLLVVNQTWTKRSDHVPKK